MKKGEVDILLEIVFRNYFLVKMIELREEGGFILEFLFILIVFYIIFRLDLIVVLKGFG